jgi:outer membrane protein OmpA-like peptidoglycan-associated protein
LEASTAEEDMPMLVEGHTDSRGSEALNLMLSKARAAAVASYLITHGVPAERVTTARKTVESRP